MDASRNAASRVSALRPAATSILIAPNYSSWTTGSTSAAYGECGYTWLIAAKHTLALQTTKWRLVNEGSARALELKGTPILALLIRTFRDKTQNEDILAELASIADELEKDMTTLQYAGKTVTVKYKVSTPLVVLISSTPISTRLEHNLSRDTSRPLQRSSP